MGSYSPEEIKAFEAKERRIVKQSCLKVAAELATIDNDSNVKEVINRAELLLEWVYGEGKKSYSETTSPVPTPDQQKALDKVLKETGYTREQVFEFSKCKYPNGRYPGMEDVDRWITAINQTK